MSESAKSTPLYDLCIVGAGYAGVNALHAAKDYLPKGSKVLIVDLRDGYAGQWRDQYPYVRLHQPYRHFTAGDVPWTLDKPRDYLAARDEVVAHLSAIAAKAAEKLDVKTLFMHRYVSHLEDGEGVSVTLESIDGKSTDQRLNIRADRLILAQGFAVEVLQPIKWGSEKVTSLSVRDPAIATISPDKLPPAIYIVGGGKTAMDCAHHLIQSTGCRVPIHMFAGRGSWFTVRETIFPTGWRRWVYGSSKLFSDWFIWITMRYRGENAAELYQTIAERDFLHSLVPEPKNFTFGLLSKTELKTIKEGVHKVHVGHVKSIQDKDGTPTALLQHGGELTEHALEPGAWVVNATGHIKDAQVLPILSEGGRVCAPQRFLIFTGPSAFVATHLFYLGKLKECWKTFRWTSMEFEPRERMGLNFTALYISNLMELIFKLPLKVLLSLYADFNRWFPWHRQLPALFNLLRCRSKLRAIGNKLLPARYPETGQRPPSNDA